MSTEPDPRREPDPHRARHSRLEPDPHLAHDPRGILYPARLPTFHREPAAPDLADRIRWFWIPRWEIAPGRVSRQRLLPFPASNLVVEAHGVSLAGPTTGASHRDLTGTGWAVGALLRPAGIAALHPDPGSLRDAEAPLEHPAAGQLHAAVAEAMADPDHDAGRHRAVRAFAAWAAAHIPAADAGTLAADADDAGASAGTDASATTGPPTRRLEANRMEEIIASDRDIVQVEQLAEALRTSVRGVQRLARRCVGLPPLAIIRRYRLQEAAQRLRDDPDATIAQIAAELGYVDHAHLGADFRRVLGLSPREYRREE